MSDTKAAMVIPQCYTVKQVAERLSVSDQTVIRMFQDLPGVCKITKGKRLRGKREFTTLRIPETVLSEFWARTTTR